MSAVVSRTSTPEQHLEAAAVAIRTPAFCTSEYSLDNKACGQQVIDILASLTKAWKGFVEENHRQMSVTSLPSNTALYNLACVQSLACELYLKLYINERCTEADFVNTLNKFSRDTVSKSFVPVAIPPFVAGDQTTVKEMVNKRLDVAEQCLQIAVTAGYGRGEKTGSLAIDHMRHKDADLLVVRAIRGFTWLD